MEDGTQNHKKQRSGMAFTILTAPPNLSRGDGIHAEGSWLQSIRPGEKVWLVKRGCKKGQMEEKRSRT